MPHRAIGLLVTLALSLLMAPLVTHAQPSGKVYRIGVLATTYWPPFDSFREGLRELGYVEGQNLALEYRWAEQRTQLFPNLAADLVRGEVDVIVTECRGNELRLKAARDNDFQVQGILRPW
jgi:putative ABC transport system substrate-binding protein